MSDRDVIEAAAGGGAGAAGAPERTGLWAKLDLPDWSAVTSTPARRALEAIAGLMSRCPDAGFDESEDRVRRAVLELYARLGRAPAREEIAGATGLDPDTVRARLAGLAGRDLLVLDEASGAVVGAYPFSERDTGHRVHLEGRSLNAMCAIDALGAGAMYGRDVSIESACRACGKDIRVATRGLGTALEAVTPAETVVWSGIQYADGCAADSLCTVLAFFCCDDHLEAWRTANHPDIEGYRLTPEEAMQVGRGIFTNMLKPALPVSTTETGHD